MDGPEKKGQTEARKMNILGFRARRRISRGKKFEHKCQSIDVLTYPAMSTGRPLTAHGAPHLA